MGNGARKKSMRIAFNIRRANWYRVLAPVVDAAMERGYYVECWHDVGNPHLNENAASDDRVPVFRHGRPTIRKYDTPKDLLKLFCDSGAHAVLDVTPPPKVLLDEWDRIQMRPKWILHVSSDSLYTVNTREEMMACDMFAVRTRYEAEAVVADKVKGKSDIATQVERERKLHGDFFCDYYKKVWLSPWDKDMSDYVRSRTVFVGTPSLDVLEDINRDAIRRKWKVPLDQPVVGFLPCPFDSGFGAYWARLFTARPWWKRSLIAASHLRFRDLLFQDHDEQVVRGVKLFCDRSGAWLITKRRHSRMVPQYLQKNSNLIVGDDSFYPHTAIELYAISDLVIGYYSSGSIEAVACNTPYLDVAIPHCPVDILEESFILYRGMFNRLGASVTLPASAFINGLEDYNLESFKIDKAARDRLVNDFIGPVDGKSSSRLLDAIERMLT
jgi:hypothetical protein